MINNITDSVVYVGANDHELDLFESQYIVPNGMAVLPVSIAGKN